MTSREGPPKHKVAALETELDSGTPTTPRKLPGRASFVQVWHCQTAVALVQTAFVIGSVYLKSSFKSISGLHFHPVIFAFCREAVAGPILCTAAYIWTGAWPRQGDFFQICSLGLCLYLNQLFYILGIDMSGVVVATCMQPAIPVFTAMLGVFLGLETGSFNRFAGIALSVTGSICMVLGGASQGDGGSADGGYHMLLGNMCLLANTLSMAVYYLLAKSLVQRYNPICVAAWAYVVAAMCMGLTAGATVQPADWNVPDAMIGPLIYWILIASVLGYYLLTAATQYLPASQVAAFQCLQPFMGTLLAFFVLGEQPSAWDLGAIGVVAGLILVVRDPKGDGSGPPFSSRV